MTVQWGKPIPISKPTEGTVLQFYPMPRIIELTPREMDVLTAFMVDAPEDREIGVRLHLGVNTVKTHMRHVREKVGVNSRAALVLAVYSGRVALRCVDRMNPADREDAPVPFAGVTWNDTANASR